LGGGARITASKIRWIGGDFGHSGSILRARRRRAASGTFSASRRSKGRHGTTALGGSHGGGALLLETFTWGRERDRARERGKRDGGQGRDKEEGEASRCWDESPGILLGLHSQAGGGARGWPGTATQQLRLTQRRRQSSFAKIPLAFGVFWKL
jgi:hypothetical protein